MTAGIGSTTAASILRQVNFLPPCDKRLELTSFLPALYRTLDSTLPDFSKMKDTDGELFFDVMAITPFFFYGLKPDFFVAKRIVI